MTEPSDSTPRHSGSGETQQAGETLRTANREKPQESIAPATSSSTPTQIAPAHAKPSGALKDFLKAFLVPVLINKAFMMYFGLKYVDNPGEGYGYWFALTVVILFGALARFFWKYRNIEDP